MSKKVLWESQIKKNDVALDIGCWDGAKIRKLKDRCVIYGMDIDSSKFRSCPLAIRERIKKGDATKQIPFKTKFDWIFLEEVLEHVDTPDKLLLNISKSLKKDGKLIMTTPRSVPFFEFWDPAYLRWRLLHGQRHYHFSEIEISKLFNLAGLKIEDSYKFGNLKWVLHRWANVIMRYLIKSKKQIRLKDNEGFCEWAILAGKK